MLQSPSHSQFPSSSTISHLGLATFPTDNTETSASIFATTPMPCTLQLPTGNRNLRSHTPSPAGDWCRSLHIYMYSTSHCIVSLVSSMQSSIVSSPNLEGNCPLRDLSVPSALAYASLCFSHSLACDGTSNLVAFAFRTRASFVIVTRALPSPLCPRLGSMLSINTQFSMHHTTRRVAVLGPMTWDLAVITVQLARYRWAWFPFGPHHF